MSQENVERALDLYEVWNRHGVEPVSESFWSPEIEWRDDPSVPDAGSYRGREEVRAHIAERVEVLGHFRMDRVRALDVDRDLVLVIYDVTGEGGKSAVPWTLQMAQSLRFEGDRVVEVQDFLDVDRALETAGLSE